MAHFNQLEPPRRRRAPAQGPGRSAQSPAGTGAKAHLQGLVVRLVRGGEAARRSWERACAGRRAALGERQAAGRLRMLVTLPSRGQGKRRKAAEAEPPAAQTV